MSAIDKINQGGTTYEIVPEIAELFSTTKAYHTGDHVIYEAGWYTFKADKTVGVWDATKVDGPFKVSDQLSDLKEDLSDMNTATSSDVGKYLRATAVENGKVTSWQFSTPSGGGGGGGQDGFSPIVAVTGITGGHRVSITDADGTETFDVMDGTNGSDGTTFTPSVSSAGVISWTNDGNKQNPSSVDLVAAIPEATTQAAGKMSATDKGRLETLYADYSSALKALGVI